MAGTEVRYGSIDFDEMAQYQAHAAPVAVAHGARLAGWFGVEVRPRIDVLTSSLVGEVPSPS